MSTSTARETALDLLLEVTRNHSYSQLALNASLSGGGLSARDKALVTQLFYGVLQHRLTLEYVLSRFVRKGVKMDDWVRLLLLLSLFQKMYLDRIPDHAMVNEAVRIAKKRGNKGIAGFVNAVLRHFLRSGTPDFSNLEPEFKRLSVRFSHPEWLLRLWTEQWGREIALAIAEADNLPPHVSVRVNRLRAARGELAKRLAAEGVKTAPGKLSPDGLIILGGPPPAETAAWRSGLATIQDESSMLVADCVAPGPGMRILDACAAPGGKTTHLAERMENRGEIVALDLHSHRAKLIDAAAERLGLTIIETRVLDARDSGTVFQPESFDRVLIDAPCTGFGVIRRKPEIRWERNAEAGARLTGLQRSILEAAAPLVRKGGWLIYSTCTINKEENERQLLRFLADHPDYSWEPSFFTRLHPTLSDCRLSDHTSMIQIFPYHYGSDGFFIGCLKKRNGDSDEV